MYIFVGVSKKLERSSKKKGCEDIRPWIKSISNHMYWVASSSGTDGDMKVAKWKSVVNHVANIHQGHGEKFPECQHKELDVERKWLRQGWFFIHIKISQNSNVFMLLSGHYAWFCLVCSLND